MGRTIRICVVLLTVGFFALVVFYYFGSERSEILISDRMSDFIDTVDHHEAKNKNKLIVFDLDDTLFMSSQILGTPTWFYNTVNLVRQSGAARYEAYSIVSKIDKIVQEKIRVIPVEQATLSAIRTWQKLGATVVGFASRPKDIADITTAQLNQIGLQFSSPHFRCVESRWDSKEGAFINGILYVDHSANKSRVFSHFFYLIRNCGMLVKLIAQAEDQQRYVTEIAQLAKDNRVDFIGIIYGGALNSRGFDIVEANRQLMDLEAALNIPIIPDEYRSVFRAAN